MLIPTLVLACLAPQEALPSPAVHTTYLWHLHQPIYWPDQRRDALEDEHEVAMGTLSQLWFGADHPQDDIEGIFGKDDRVAAYQWRLKDSIQTLLGYPDAGAHVNYSGSLAQNVGSLGTANQLGYSGSWASHLAQAQGWQTSGGTPRASMVQFAHHHALMPLQTPRTRALQILLHQERLAQVWGLQPGQLKGFFPPETAFTTRMIPQLVEAGVEWSFVSNEHLSRACPDFPVELGSGGVMCDPPNRADQVNDPGVDWFRKTISRGCSPVNALPFAYRAHRAQHVDPATGAVSEIVVVPTAQALSWDDGYGPQGASALAPIAQANDPARPSLVVLAHDGDNAWGGGFSYYQEAVPNFVADAAASGYRPSTVDRYLADYPVPAGDVVHVEDGAWVNADSDFGSPLFTNWLYPLLDGNGNVDPTGGWHNKAREYAIFIATEARIRAAEDLAGGPATTRIDHVLDPRFGTTGVERAWHYYLAGMDSGNVYYGNPLDMEVKGTVACNEALEHVEPLLAGVTASSDATAPSLFPVQRWPWNPGAVNFGAPYGYQPTVGPQAFTVWTFADDVTGVQGATLRYRLDVDGANPLSSHQNETFAGGSEVGAWLDVPMQLRPFPADNVHGYGGLEAYAFEQPARIAQHLSATVPALPERLLDYYVEVVDAAGNVARSEIHHVWVGDGQATGPGGTSVELAPDPPVKGEPLAITYDPAGGPLPGASPIYVHLGQDDWAPGTVQHLPMQAAGDGTWSFTFQVPASAFQVDCVFNDTADGQGGIWDNNGGADWHFTTVDAPAGPLTVGPKSIELALEPGDAVDPIGLTLDAAQPLVWAGLIAPGQGAAELGRAEASLERSLASVGGAGPVAKPVALLGWVQLAASAGQLAAPGGVELRFDTARLPEGVHEAAAVFLTDAGGAAEVVPITVTVAAPPPTPPAATGVDPNPPLAGQTVRIWYLAGGTALASKPAVFAHVGLDGWDAATIQDLSMVQAAPNAWFLDYDLPPGTFELDFVFNDGAGTWDNNGGQDWIFAVQ